MNLTKKLHAYREKIDELTLSLDKEMIDALKSLDKGDIQLLRNQKTSFTDMKQRIDSGDKKISDLSNTT